MLKICQNKQQKQLCDKYCVSVIFCSSGADVHPLRSTEGLTSFLKMPPLQQLSFTHDKQITCQVQTLTDVAE